MHDERDSYTSLSAFATNASPASQTSSLAECSELLSCIGEIEEFNLGSSSWAWVLLGELFVCLTH